MKSILNVMLNLEVLTKEKSLHLLRNIYLNLDMQKGLI